MSQTFLTYISDLSSDADKGLKYIYSGVTGFIDVLALIFVVFQVQFTHAIRNDVLIDNKEAKIWTGDDDSDINDKLQSYHQVAMAAIAMYSISLVLRMVVWRTSEAEMSRLTFFFIHLFSCVGAILFAISVDSALHIVVNNLPTELSKDAMESITIDQAKEGINIRRYATMIPPVLYTLIGVKLCEYLQVFRYDEESRTLNEVASLTFSVIFFLYAILLQKNMGLAEHERKRGDACDPVTEVFEDADDWRRYSSGFFFGAGGLLFVGFLLTRFVKVMESGPGLVKSILMIAAYLIPWILYGVYIGKLQSSYYNKVCKYKDEEAEHSWIFYVPTFLLGFLCIIPVIWYMVKSPFALNPKVQ